MKKFLKVILAVLVLSSVFATTGNKAEAKSINSYTYSDYFSNSVWITRSGVKSLSITPKMSSPLIKSRSGNERMAHANRSWTVLRDKHKTSRNWKNNASMHAQYHCHVAIPNSMKTPWNLEPHRTESNLSKVVAKGCNP